MTNHNKLVLQPPAVVFELQDHQQPMHGAAEMLCGGGVVSKITRPLDESPN